MKTPTIERFALNSNSLVPSSARPEAREVDVVFISGAPISRWDRYSGEQYIMSLEPAGADLSRLNGGAAPVLDSHQDGSLSTQLGIVVKAWRAGGQLLATLKFSERPAVEPIWRDVLAGVQRAVSVGAEIIESHEEKDGAGRLVKFVATKWRPLEISLVTIPADAGAVALKYETNGVTQVEQNQQNTEVLASERGRVSEINRIATSAQRGKENPQYSGIAETAIRNGTSVEDFKAAILDVMVAEDMKNDTRVGSIAATSVRDAGDTTRLAMTEALFARSLGRAPAEIGRMWHGRRVADMARECLSIRGVRVSGGDATVIREALMHGAGDFPNLLSGLAGKTLLESYSASESVLKQVSRRSSVSDFKEKHVLRRGEYPGFFQVHEGAQYTSGAIGEHKESYAIATFGRLFVITRQALVNDDLGAFSDFAFMVGQAAADFEATYLVSLLTANAGAGPVMGDGHNLFDAANHGNSGAGVIGITALDAARTAMRTQKGVDGVTVIDARPKTLVVPAARQTIAEQYVTQITPAASSNVNPFAGQLVTLAEPRLDAKSTARWYLFGDPAFAPALEYSYLSGSEGVQIEQRVGFDIDGLEVKARLDFGAAAIDWRGVYVSTGA